MTAWPRTLHARLTVAYAVGFFVGLLAFAVISYAALDAALKTIVDARLQSAAAAVAGIVAGDPEVGHATRERLELVIGSNLSSAVFSADGRAIYSSVLTIAAPTRTQVLRAGGRSVRTMRTISGADERMLTQRIGTSDGPRYVGVWRQLDVVEDLERLALVIFGVTVVVTGGIAVLVGATVARQGLTPLRAVAELASEIEAHDLSRRLGFQDDVSELGRLCTTFDRMLGRLQAAFERQRRFTADASHELRAPLSIIHVAADLALRRERDPAAYRKVLSSVLQATQQLEDLTDRLLAAARADAGYATVERVELAGLLGEVLDRLRPLAEAKQVAFLPELQSPVYVDADRTAIVRVAIALIDNAIKFSPRGGAVTVSLVHERERGRVRLSVGDEGPGFSRAGLEHATERFWRDDVVRVPGSGSGLGLAICDSIVRSSRGTLTLGNGRGALVVVDLPSPI